MQKYLFIRKISTPLKRIKIHSRISFQKLSQTNAQLYTIFSSLKCHRNNTDERGSEKKKYRADRSIRPATIKKIALGRVNIVER